MFDELIKMHLKDDEKSIGKAQQIMSIMKADNVDAKVEKFAREIIGVLS